MRHLKQLFNFRQREFPLANNSMNWLMRPNQRALNMGDLFEHLADILHSVPFCLSNPVDFTLVNVVSPHAQWSIGCNEGPPPEVTWPANTMLLFTFALKQDNYYPVTDEVQRKSFKSAYVNTWNMVPSAAPQFLNVAINPIVCAHLGLRTLTWSRIQYLYYVVGMMTKSFVRRHQYYGSEASLEFYSFSDYNLEAVRQKYWAMKLPQLAATTPFKMWCFNRNILETAPHWLSTRHLSPELALYYVANVKAGPITLKNKTAGDLNQRLLFGPNGVVDMIGQSVMSFLQMVETPGDTQLETIDRIAPMMIDSLMSGKRIKLTADYMQRSADQAHNLVNLFQDRKDLLPELLTPPKDAAMKLFMRDRRLATKLNELTE